jgi:DNA repair exonuclease SbcCD ATPase subunit
MKRSMNTWLLISLTALAGCTRGEEEARPALERAQEKIEESMDKVETRLAEGTAEARKAWAAAVERWDALQPKAEQAVARLEERIGELMNDSEALKRLPPRALERAKTQLESLRAKLAEARTDHEQGNTDLAVEKADDVQQESAAVEELLVENPDPPSSKPGK